MRYGLVIAVLAAAVTQTVVAHHSFAAEFDASKEIKITGKVTKLEWMNPHAWFHMVPEEICEGPAGSEQNGTWKCSKVEGAPAEWAFELASPNGLMRQGWTRNSLKPGDAITTEGTRAKDGGPRGNARAVMMVGGKRLFAGSSQGATP
jgi:uncharacterized protein DUF6152